MHRKQTDSSSSSSKLHRNLLEKNRRMHMKDLISRLANLINPQPTQQDNPPIHMLLDQATTYVKRLQETTDELKQRKKELQASGSGGVESSDSPTIILNEWGSDLEVVLVSGPNRKFMLHEVISILQEEGAEVINTSFSTMGDRVFCTIHSRAISSRIGIATSSVHERLKKVVH